MSMPSGKQGPSGPFAKAVAAQVREAMARHRISAARLAPLVDVSQSYLSKRLRDEVSLTLNDVEAICGALGEDLPGFMIDSSRALGGEQ